MTEIPVQQTAPARTPGSKLALIDDSSQTKVKTMTLLRIAGLASILGFGLLNGISFAHADGVEEDIDAWVDFDAESEQFVAEEIDAEDFSDAEFLDAEFDPALLGGAEVLGTFSRPPTCTTDDDRLCFFFGLICVGECKVTCCRTSGDHTLCGESSC